MKIKLLNRQKHLRLRLTALHALTSRLRDRAALEAPRGPWRSVATIFCDDEGMIPVNRACFGKHRTTDVISLAYADDAGGPVGPSAEIFVNVELAVRRAGRGPAGQKELALYLAHGLDHLAGATDRTPRQRRAMLRREGAWLRAAASEGLLNNLWA